MVSANQDKFIVIFIIILVICGTVLYVIYGNKPEEEELEWEEVADLGKPSEIISDFQFDFGDEVTQLDILSLNYNEAVSTPTKEMNLESLEAGSYENLEITLTGDSYVMGKIDITNSVINLEGHNLIFEEEAEVNINTSTFRKAGRNEADLELMKAYECQADVGSEDCGNPEDFKVPTGGIVVKSKKFEMLSSAITENEGHGIYLYNASEAFLEDNRIYDNLWNGIKVQGGSDTTFLSNMLINNGCTKYSREFDRKEGTKEECTKDNLNFGSMYFAATEGIIITDNAITGDVIFQDENTGIDFAANFIDSPSDLLINCWRVDGLVKENVLSLGDIIIKGKDGENLYVFDNEVGGDIFYTEEAKGVNIEGNLIKGQYLDGGNIYEE